MKEILIIIFVSINGKSIFILQKHFKTTECYKNPLFGIEPDQRKLCFPSSGESGISYFNSYLPSPIYF